MRKLIDIPDEVFDSLSDKARASGKNLKNYIEGVLEEDAAIYGESGRHYRFTMQREPTEKELKAVMDAAAREAAIRWRSAEDKFFDTIDKAVAYDN